MAFADLKNDFAFRRIFVNYADLLCSLLNDLLERSGKQTIETIEYLPIEQYPLAAGAKLSILDVRCKDRSGTTFVVEMQLVHVDGFINRWVYNACKMYIGLQESERYAQVTDVVVISICEFELWPDAKQWAQGLPLVPVLSRWNMTERKSEDDGLLQVQYVFLELPKLASERPREPGAELWAWLFVHAPELTEIPADLRSEPHRRTLELANKATFTQGELEAYRRVIDEIHQAEELAEASWREGFAEAYARSFAEADGRSFAECLAEGRVKARAKARAKREAAAKVAAVLAVLAARRIPVPDSVRARIETCQDVTILDRWIARAATAGSAEDVLASPA